MATRSYGEGVNDFVTTAAKSNKKRDDGGQRGIKKCRKLRYVIYGRPLRPVFPNLFLFGAPLISIAGIWRHPQLFFRYKDRGIVTIGGTPVTSSRHPSVPRHPGWEPLDQSLETGLKMFQKRSAAIQGALDWEECTRSECWGYPRVFQTRWLTVFEQY